MKKPYDGQELITKIVSRLSRFYRDRWRKRALDHKEQKGDYPDFKNFVKFIERSASDANDPVYGYKAESAPAEKKIPKGYSHATCSKYKQGKSHNCPKCQECHRLYMCDQFKGLNVDARQNFVKTKHLCFNCLLSNHTVSDCKSPVNCRYCGKRHNSLLHVFIQSTDPVQSEPVQSVSQLSSCSETSVPDVTVSNLNPNADEFTLVHSNALNVEYLHKTMLPLVPVTVNDRVRTYALLDPASTHSFVKRDLTTELGLKGTKTKLNLSTMNQSSENVTRFFTLNIAGSNGSCITVPRAFQVEDIPVPNAKLSGDYSHLADLAPVDPLSVSLLIGQDCSDALIPHEVRVGQPGEPYAIRTLLGWCICGPASNACASSTVVTMCISAQQRDINTLWEIDQEMSTLNEKSLSLDDKHVLQLWEDNLNVIDGKYELPIPWKSGRPQLPNNHDMAVRRLQNLLKRLKKEQLVNQYNLQIQKFLSQGYAEHVPESEVDLNDGSVWYLPHHHVKKRDGNLRIVHDCAAEVNGISLNKSCHQGPDLNNQLIGVLLRFRQYAFAFTGDIQAMYMQVKVPEKDRNALRFLWAMPDGNIVYLRMTSHLFGGVWCAAVATFALRKTVQLNEVEPNVSKTICKSFYVDDLLKSCSSKSELEEILFSTQATLKLGGFNLTKFIANDKRIMQQIPEADQAKEAKMPSKTLKTLGIKWNTVSDQFHFTVNSECATPVTKRQVLKCVAAIYDPFGLISPVILIGRILLQEITRLNLGWDQEVPQDICQRWTTWITSLKSLERLNINRCITPLVPGKVTCQLHHFCDASQAGYGMVSYLRCEDESGDVTVSLLYSKARVSPMKQMTIPRLELCAALLSVKIDSTLRSELDICLETSVFWSDSQIVLAYIADSSKRYHTFVANRISQIRSQTSPFQWRYIPGIVNPADISSRGANPTKLTESDWFTGPEFLYQKEENWPSPQTNVVAKVDPEVKVRSCLTQAEDSFSHGPTQPEPMSYLDELISRNSNLLKLKRIVAWLILIKTRLLNRPTSIRITCVLLNEAEEILVRHEQKKLNQKDYAALSPYLDENGLVRVGGRLKNYISGHSNPLIIPRGHLSTLMIREQHEKSGHMGVEYVLANLRAKGKWIPRKAVKSVLNACVVCKRYFGRPLEQKMADLPPKRVNPSSPFTHVGVDCFGPFTVKRGRTEVKRWGCIFTCLSTRALHIESLENMSTESFLNSMTRFMARRGKPASVISDNGGNFVKGNTELTKGIKEWNQAMISEKLQQDQIEWKFNPPCCSHRGGVWERQIRSIRKVLMVIMNTQIMSDEVLNTVFAQAEEILNNRPITKLSDQPHDPRVLRPSDILLSSSRNVSPSVQTFSADLYRNSWRQSQYLVDLFWSKWIRHYLPELQGRQKWRIERNNLKIGDVVLVTDVQTYRNFWPLGLVTDVIKSDDGLVRTVKLRCQGKEIIRSINKVVFLEGSL